MSSNPIIVVNKLCKTYTMFDTPGSKLLKMLIPKFFEKIFSFYDSSTVHNALIDVTFSVCAGETVGVIGRNGSGKSTLLQILCGTLEKTSGNVEVNGKVSALLELGSGFNPEFTGRENLLLYAAISGLSKDDVSGKLNDIIDFADIGDFIDRPIKTYSSGMVMRLAFAVSIYSNQRIMIVDEALAVGDAAFQRKCFKRLEELVNNGMTLLFVSHDPNQIRTLCKRALYLASGKSVAFGEAREIADMYERDLFGIHTINSYGSDCEKNLDMASTNDDLGKFDDINENRANRSEESSTYSTSSTEDGDTSGSLLSVLLCDEDGNKTKLLKHKNKYVLQYKFKANSRIESPVFGYSIKTFNGILVTGCNSIGSDFDRKVKYLDRDDVVNVTFEFINMFSPGEYFISVGVHHTLTSGDISFAHRKLDVISFRSYDDGALNSRAIVSLTNKIIIDHEK